MKRITAILILTFICQFNTSYSQTKTPYQKKVDQIMSEMCKAIGVENSLIQMAVKLNDWDLVKTSQDFAFKSKMMDRNELLVIVLATDQKLKDAEKLKNSVDNKRDSDKRTKEETEKKLAEDKINADQRARIEKREQEEIQIQLKDEERRKQEKLDRENLDKIHRYNNSDYVSIINNVSDEFNKWLVKGEFEKSENYLARLSDSELLFDSICNEIISNRISYIAQTGYNLELGNYNADNETFPVKIRLASGFSFNDTISVIINDAEKFKKIYNKIDLPEAEADWVMIDNYLNPKKIFVNNIDGKNQIILNVPHVVINNGLSFTTSEMKLTNYNGEIIKYDLNTYQKKKEQLLKIQKKRKHDEFVKLALEEEEKENYSSALSLYQKALEIENKSEFLKEKIVKLNSKINEIKRAKLIVEAEELKEIGQLSKSKQKYSESNEILKTSDVDKIIEEIDFEIQRVNGLKTELLEKFNYASKNHKFAHHYGLDAKVNSSYFDKLNECIDTINIRMNKKWSIINDLYSSNISSDKKEQWTESNQLILNHLIDFIAEEKKYKQFDEKIVQAFREENKKLLKALKEKYPDDIINKVIAYKI